MNKAQPNSSRNRLRELLAVPERLRTEAQWDEINELEIELAPGNREGAPLPGPRRHGAAPQGRNKQGGGGGGGGSPGKKAAKKFHQRAPKGGNPR